MASPPEKPGPYAEFGLAATMECDSLTCASRGHERRDELMRDVRKLRCLAHRHAHRDRRRPRAAVHLRMHNAGLWPPPAGERTGRRNHDCVRLATSGGLLVCRWANARPLSVQ